MDVRRGRARPRRRDARSEDPHPPAELRAYWELGIRSVWIGAKQDLAPRDQVELFLEHEPRLQREILKRGSGPWALAMTAKGIRPIILREP